MNAQLRGHVDVRVDALTLATARRDVALALRGWGVTDVRAVEEALVVVSELIGNALRYGGTLVAVELDRRGDGVLVSVLDSSPALPRPRNAALDAEGGRGLLLVAEFSAAWGAAPRVGGKRVWALLRPAAGHLDGDGGRAPRAVHARRTGRWSAAPCS